MDLRKTTILILTLSLTLSLAAGFDSGATANPPSECTDGNDNDDDTMIDKDDTGCATPYYRDDSEANAYDMDASWILAGKQAPTLEGPTVYYGFYTELTGNVNRSEDGGFGNYITESYIKDADQGYGAGTQNTESITFDTDFYKHTDRGPDNWAQLVDHPYQGQCGDGIEQGTETPDSCPEDKGLPDDYIGSDEKITDTMNDYSYAGKTVPVRYDVADDTSNTEGREFKGDDASSSEKDATGTCSSPSSSSSCSDYTKVFDLQRKEGYPDFYLEDDLTEIHAIQLSFDEVKIGEVTDYGIVDESVDKVGDSSPSSYDSYNSDCSDSHTNCSDGQTTECTSYSSQTLYKFPSSNPGTKTIGTGDSSYEREVVPGSSEGSFKVSDITQQSLEMTLEYDKEPVTKETIYVCSNEKQIEDDTCTGDPSTNGVSCGNDVGYYTTSSTTEPTNYDSSKKIYKYKEMTFPTTEVFDLVPSSNTYTMSAKKVLFNTDSFHSGERGYISGDWQNIQERAFAGIDVPYYSWPVVDDKKNQGNDPAVSATQYEIDIDSSNDFRSNRTDKRTYDADGPDGRGDGFLAINDGAIDGYSNTLVQRETYQGSQKDYIQRSTLANANLLNCEGSYVKCVRSVDVSTSNITNWAGLSPLDTAFAEEMEDEGGPFYPDMSLGVAKLYDSLYKNKNGNFDSGLTYTDDNSNSPTTTDSCGDQVGERYAYMEGPEVNENEVSENASSYEACLKTAKSNVTESSCVLSGKVVNEGRVANLAPRFSTEPYEQGGNSPDWEVCLDLRDTGLGNEGDERAGDNLNNDLTQEDYGGEWYDLDSERAQNYLRGLITGMYSTESGRQLVSNTGDVESTGEGNINKKDIDFYWNSSINPPNHANYNPEGGRPGTALEDDCGNPRFDSLNCNDPQSLTNRQATFFSFFNEGKREEDYNPHGNNSGNNKLTGFNGYVNRLQESSNQIESGMDTDTFDPSTQSFWQNSVGGNDADSWAITENLRWSIDTTGHPYPPYSTYYRDSSDQRTNSNSNNVDKRIKAFANSYAAVAKSGFTGEDQGLTVNQGDGVWIDPDNVINNGQIKLDEFDNDWKQVLSSTDETGNNRGFKIDLTGPDSGLGIDVSGMTENPECLQTNTNGGCIVKADNIYWERGSSGSIDNSLERIMCGDDQNEYFIEEIGESRNTERYDGKYACSDSLNSCYDSKAPIGERVVDRGSYTNADEPNESVGRLKKDQERCEKIPDKDDFAVWYDQDYKTTYCRQKNELYGTPGKRWISNNIVENNTESFTQGVDDDWNVYLSERGRSNMESDPGSTDPSKSPVSTGDSAQRVATKGFCLGDDKSEYLITQRCNTDLCETNNQYVGAADDPEKCLLEENASKVSGVNLVNDGGKDGVINRDIYDEGEKVEVEGAESGIIGCYGGSWHSNWPINFLKDNVSVVSGQEYSAAFQVINVNDESEKFDIELQDGSDYDSFLTLEKTGTDEMRVEVPASTTKTYSMNVDANKVLPTNVIEIDATTPDGSFSGEDSISVKITKNPSRNLNGTTGETRDVPGIGLYQLAWLVMAASVLYFFSLSVRRP